MSSVFEQRAKGRGRKAENSRSSRRTSSSLDVETERWRWRSCLRTSRKRVELGESEERGTSRRAGPGEREERVGRVVVRGELGESNLARR